MNDLERCPTCGCVPPETPIRYMPLDEPTRNLLLRNGIETVEHLQRLTWGDLLALRGIGDLKAHRIRSALTGFVRRFQ